MFPEDDSSSDAMNVTQEELMKRLEHFTNNKAIDDTALIILLVLYATLIIFGTTGNGLVCAAVIRKPSMRTDRNVFIINLAISDLLLCLFVMPFSLVEIAFKYWQLGGLMCKLGVGLQATSIFVSAISITAIALDRYRVIVNPSQRGSCHHPVKTMVTLSGIWFFALILASPLFYYRQVQTLDLETLKISWLPSVDYCIENWPLQHGRAIYSICSMVVQYVIPILIVSIAYMGILRKLKHRMVRESQLDDKKRRDKQRIRKTNLLLFSVAFIFGISWLPLNILNIVADLTNIQIEESKFRIYFAICHMIGMSSACSNPLLYGWLNDNFRKEFVDIFAVCSPSLARRSLTIVDTEVALDQNGTSNVNRRASEMVGPNRTTTRVLEVDTSPPGPRPNSSFMSINNNSRNNSIIVNHESPTSESRTQRKAILEISKSP